MYTYKQCNIYTPVCSIRVAVRRDACCYLKDLASRPWLPMGQNWSQGLALFALVSAMRRCARAVCLDVAGIDLPGLRLMIGTE